MELLEKQSLLVREANDRTSKAQTGSASALIAFECECGDLYCWETVSLSQADYTAFRAAENGGPLLTAHHDYALRQGHTDRVSPSVW
jgi:hypothetical protein